MNIRAAAQLMPSSLDEDAWDDLLSFIEERRVIPIIGPELLQVATDRGPRLLYDWLAEKLAGGRIALPWRALVVGLAAIVIANVGFMVLATAWAYTTGSASDLFEVLGYTIVGISVLLALDVHRPANPREEES